MTLFFHASLPSLQLIGLLLLSRNHRRVQAFRAGSSSSSFIRQ
ncbi:unnamed protein product, partial [Ectocarpus fasciculatus]